MWIETDGSESTLPVDASAHLCLDVGLAPVNRARLLCGKDSENLFTFSSAKKVGRKSNPYIGESVFRCPHMGVSFLA